MTKSREPGLLPARIRYESARIDAARSQASQDDVAFRVLSGRFGLIADEDQLPWYDHLLRDGEVAQLAMHVAGQLRACEAQRVVYVTRPVGAESAVAPYLSTIHLACERVGVAIEVREISGGATVTSNRDIMGRAEACKRALIGDRPTGERCFDELLSAHPGDGMVYFKRAEGFEFHKDFVRAADDYDRAGALLWDPAWQERARSGAGRARAETAARPPTTGKIDDRFMGEVYNGLQRVLDAIEGGRPQAQETMVARISRLASAGLIPAGTANSMQSLRIARNQATKEYEVFEGADADAIRANWRAVREWAEGKGYPVDRGDAPEGPGTEDGPSG